MAKRCGVSVCLVFFCVLFNLEEYTLGMVDDCPAAECLCDRGEDKFIDCVDFKLEVMPYFHEENITYNRLDLSENEFKKIREEAFHNLKVMIIVISGNKRRELKLYPKAFRGLENTLKEIKITQSQVRHLPRGLFRGLHKVEFIDLWANLIRTIEVGAFKGASNALHLDLAGNSIQHLDAKVFVGLKSLKTLDLYRNDISVIASRALGPLHSLTELHLQNNQIRDLQPRVFKSLNKLQLLDLHKNNIPALFPLMFRGLPALQKLNMKDNKIMMIGKDTFTSMNNLTELDISKNHITYLEADVFRGLKFLQQLYLRSNSLMELQDGLFKHVPKLKRLDVEDNSLTTINACAFYNYKDVKEIRALHNRIHCDCTMKWTTETASPEVDGLCETPEIYRDSAIEREDKYMVCIHDSPDCNYRYKKRYRRKRYKLNTKI